MSRRRLRPDERSLWTDVTRSIAPLPKRRIDDAHEPEPAVTPPLKVKAKPKSLPKNLPKALPVPALAAPRPVPRQEPAPLGRRAKRRLSRGADEIHGRLDLHGLTQAQAHDALLRYLRSSQARGAKVLLVITGKGTGERGGDATGGRGVLKRQVPMWLRLPEFREFVAGFEAAAIGHGGEGAMYVRLRSLRN